MSNISRTEVGHRLAKVLGIKLNYRDPLGASDAPITRGESTFSNDTADTYAYYEEEPSSVDWVKEHTPSFRQILYYFYSIFPFLSWIGYYNWQWFLGDLVSGEFLHIYQLWRLFLLLISFSFYTGVTVGAVVVPQGMAYAKLAKMPIEYGLYTSFMGVLVYWLFATSKDITIGVSNEGECGSSSP